MHLPGRLLIDGASVPSSTLTHLVDELTTSLESCGIRPGTAVVTTARTGIAVIATVMAADRLGAAVVLGEAPGDQPVPPVVRARVKEGPPARLEAYPVPALMTEEAALPPDSAAVFWTSGSTGTPKAVLLSREALDYQAAAGSERFGVTRQDTWLVPLPLNHAYGFSVLRMWLREGPTLHLLSSPRAQVIASHVSSSRTTLLDGVPSLYSLLSRLAERDTELRRGLAGLRLRGCGGDVLPPALARAFASVVGEPIHDGYGLTEAGPNVAVSAPGCHREGTVGRALRGTRLRTAAHSGELLVRGPGLMTGYLDDLDSTAAALTADGWLRTGDRGEVDTDGFLRITGRLKDVLIIQGETVAPSVLEQVLGEVPGVLDAAVVGVRMPGAHARGDTVNAYVTLEVPGSATIADLERACRATLPPAHRPRRIDIVKTLPRLPSGKLDRAALRRKAQGHHA